MNTTLENWVKYGWLVRHETGKQEIADLLAIADRDIQTARLPDLPADWRLSIAYNAALQSTNAALAASGYRAEKSAQHYRIIQTLEHTIELAADTIDRIDAFRKKRNVSSYDRSGSVSEGEANAMLLLAQKLRQAVEDWIRANYPELM